MNIIEVAKNAKEIMASKPVSCPACGAKWFSPFDKLYVAAYSKCIDCSTFDEWLKQTDNISTIIESVE